MRALLLVNPKATTTSERGRDVLVRALRSEVDLDVEYTKRRGHAAELSKRAAEEGVDLVVTLGGDGTVNEAVNGILGARPPDHPRPTDRAGASGSECRPALAVVPGGSTNVFARALGLPREWPEGTGVILDAVHNRRTRTIGLGRADDRYFTFCAGFGLDAEVVRSVERARLRGKVPTAGRYVRATVTQFFLDTDRSTPSVTLERPGAPAEVGLVSAIIQNTAPWTYLGDWPVNPCPEASFDHGLDVLAMRALRLPATTRTVVQILSRRPNPRGRSVLRLHDLRGFTLRAARPLAFQVDGDYLGEKSMIVFTAVPHALRVFC